MTKPTPKDNWTEEQWHKHAKTLIDGMRKSKFEFGKLVEQFHDHFNRHRDQYKEDWTVVCQRVLILKHPTCSLYETIWKILGRAEFRDKLPSGLHTLHKIAQTYSVKPEVVVKAVEDGKINLSTTEVEATGFYSEAIETLPNERVALVRTSNPQRMSHESAWLEALMDKLYKAYSPTRVDAVMMAVMYEEETIEGIGEGIRRFGGIKDFAHVLEQYYGSKGSETVTRIIEHDPDTEKD